MAKSKYDFNKVCAFCEHASIMNDREKMLCEFKGVVVGDYCCRKFVYDPLKRNPEPVIALPGAKDLDLEL